MLSKPCISQAALGLILFLCLVVWLCHWMITPYDYQPLSPCESNLPTTYTQLHPLTPTPTTSHQNLYQSRLIPHTSHHPPLYLNNPSIYRAA